MCDDSDYAIGAVLGQMEDKKAFVIYYVSKTLDAAQVDYTTTEKEFLAVIFALENFRSYIVGSLVVRPEKFQFMEKRQNRNFGYKIVISVKNMKFIL